MAQGHREIRQVFGEETTKKVEHYFLFCQTTIRSDLEACNELKKN